MVSRKSANQKTCKYSNKHPTMMRYLIVCVHLVLLPSFLAAVPLQGKIVNGTNAGPGEYPYAVSYRYFDEHNCGGSIIGRKWVLTAAHCIHDEFTNVSSILFGSTLIQNGLHPLTNTRNIKRAIRHPRYEEFGGYENDIGLIELEEPVEFNKFIQPVHLPKAFASTPEGRMAKLVGWGYAESDGDVMENLQEVEIVVYSDEACKQAHGEVFNPQVHVCAGVPEGGKGQCSGDSGGPLAVDGVQVGIVSWSVKPCTIKGFPGVFSKVSTYRNWVHDVTGI